MNRTVFITLLLAVASSHCYSQQLPSAKPARMEQRILALGEFGKNPEGGVSRVAYTAADIQGRKYFMDLMQKAGLTVRIDEAGNIVGKRAGKNASGPSIAFGSHIDSVPNGGNYDGDVGSLGALECIELLNEANITTNHPLEIYIFQNEEGGLTGSEAVSGLLTTEALDHISVSGKTIRQGITDLGGNVSQLAKAKRKKGDFVAWLELHIEQGGTLERDGIQIGVVEGIVGINQWNVTVQGKANHAGTTPMNQRTDALVAASRMITAVNQTVKAIPGRQVATVGRVKAEPGAPNVIPGKVEMSLEIRDLSHEKIMSTFSMIQSAISAIATETGTTVTYAPLNVHMPSLNDPGIMKLVASSAAGLKLSSKVLPSGAGHDTQAMAALAPTGMIFVPSKDGISHAPAEYTSPKDMANGVDVLLRVILELDK